MSGSTRVSKDTLLFCRDYYHGAVAEADAEGEVDAVAEAPVEDELSTPSLAASEDEDDDNGFN